MGRSNSAVGEAHRAYLRTVIARTRTPPTTLAKKIDVAPSTFTKLLKEPPESPKTLHGATLAKLEAYSGIPAPSTLGAARGIERGFRETDAIPFALDASGAGGEIATAIAALIGGRNAIDPWTIRSRALELAGFLPGDIVLVDLNRAGEPRPGEAVCAQVYDLHSGTAETVMRIFERAGPVSLLLAASLDPVLRQPLVVDSERVSIRGVLLPHRLRA